MNLKDLGDFFSLEGEAECKSCKGTGLYAGLAEKEGARVICRTCEGIGKIKISFQWNKFKKKKIDKNATRVYTNGMGYVITDKDVTIKGENGEDIIFPFSQYGCSYKDWLKGTTPKPLKFLGCPYQHTNQRLQTEDVNDLYKTRCHENIGYGLISNCKLYHCKGTCWDIYEGGVRGGNNG